MGQTAAVLYNMDFVNMKVLQKISKTYDHYECPHLRFNPER